MPTKRLIVGISGASGAPLAAELLRQLKQTDLESHLVITRGGALTIEQETGLSVAAVKALADVCYDNENISAGPASGSFDTVGMVVVPCSMKTAAGIYSGYSDNLLLRAADVTLKEQRRLVLVARESPLSTLHLRNLYELSRMGAMICPPMLSYYSRPASVEEMTRQAAARILSRFCGDLPALYHWEG